MLMQDIRSEPLAFRYKYLRRDVRSVEALLLVILILVFIWVSTQKIWELRAAAERAGVVSVVGVLRSALGIATAEKVMREGLQAITVLDGSNPMHLLHRPPVNYLGELEAPDPAAVDGHQWYFDTADGTLVYRVKFDDAFGSAVPGPARIRFRIRLGYIDHNRNQRFDPDADTVQTLDLVALEPYHWNVKE